MEQLPDIVSKDERVAYEVQSVFKFAVDQGKLKQSAISVVVCYDVSTAIHME